VNRDSELTAPKGIGSGDFHEKAVKGEFSGTWDF
jgi:hypothetical protein